MWNVWRLPVGDKYVSGGNKYSSSVGKAESQLKLAGALFADTPSILKINVDAKVDPGSVVPTPYDVAMLSEVDVLIKASSAPPFLFLVKSSPTIRLRMPRHSTFGNRSSRCSL